MQIRRAMPDLTTTDMDATKRFYTEVLGFDLAMDMGWVVTFVSPDNPTAQITCITEDASAGVVPNVTVEVGDVDAVHADAVARGLSIVHPLTDEPWGVRRFFVEDPSGAVINVMSHPD